MKTPKAHRATQVPIPPDAAVSVDLCDMDDILAAGYDDYHSTVSGYTDIDVFPAIGGPEAESLLDLDFGMSELHFDPAVAGGGTFDMPLLLCQKRDTVAANAVQGSADLCDMDDDIEAQQAEHLPLDHDDTVLGYVVPLDSLGLDTQDIDAFFTGDCPEFEVERIFELISAESQRANAAMKMRSSRDHKKRRRDTADDDMDAGVARGAPPSPPRGRARRSSSSRHRGTTAHGEKKTLRRIAIPLRHPLRWSLAV